ncbi:unnamed protein product [Arabidopsis arenosa]|uniref:Uncharacterized protein n=1 Tax=Arabidopsis arenosa TaxID=38785 RepID=A0A8S1ZDC5_ARAAE|nr:unnamed protein product [Arabidopsis arenosa]
MREGSHLIVLPFPGQGHITPMSQFCKRLASKGLKLTLVLVSDKPSPPYKTEHDSITVFPISNGFQEGEEPLQDLDDYMERVETSIKNTLPNLIEDMKQSGNPPRAIVYDSTMPWLLDVAHTYGLSGAAFFTQPWLVTAIYYHVFKGSFSVPSTKYGHSTLASFPSFPMLNANDLPSFLCESSSYPNILRIVVDQLSNIDQVDIVLCNTFDKLEEKLLKWVQSLWPVLNIGPTIPSMYLDKRLSEDKNYGFSLFNAKVVECTEWLNSKQPNSVVYISFGSLVILKEDQMLELAAASKGLKLTLVLVSDKPSPPYKTEHDSIAVVPISNGFEEGEERSQVLDDYMERVESSIKNSLPKLIEDMKLSGNPPRALVYDSTMPWLLDVAHTYGLSGAVFFTQPWIVSAIYYHVFKGSFSVPYTKYGHSTLASFPSFPMLNANDLPSFLCESSSYPYILRTVIDQLSNIDRVDIVLCNTFDKLEEKLLKWVQSVWPVLNIGPTVPSMYLDKRLPEDKNYGFSLFDAKIAECIEWLNSKQPNSVVYVSFGSMVVLKEDQLIELAAGLKQSRHFFLWVVRETEKNKLPENYIEEIGEKGLIVSWSPQLEVLTHKSIGCFLTHCGWNSTLEGLSLGVPMIGMPHWADQPTNAKFIEDVWKVGVRVKADGDGFVRREEIVRRVGEVMEGGKGKEIRKNTEKWKELAREAVSQGGSSDKSIDEFVSML